MTKSCKLGMAYSNKDYVWILKVLFLEIFLFPVEKKRGILSADIKADLAVC